MPHEIKKNSEGEKIFIDDLRLECLKIRIETALEWYGKMNLKELATLMIGNIPRVHFPAFIKELRHLQKVRRDYEEEE